MSTNVGVPGCRDDGAQASGSVVGGPFLMGVDWVYVSGALARGD